MKQSFSAILFNCSGVIIDSKFHQFISWKRLFDEEGVPFTMVDFQMKVSGGTREAGVRAMMGNILEERIKKLARRKQKIFDQFVALDIPGAFPGIADLLIALRARGVALAAVSASRNAHALLVQANLLHYFDAVVTPSQQELIFSNKELYARAMKQLGVEAGQCVVVEDSPLSIAATKQMGAFIIGIAMIVPPNALHDANRVVTNHKELRDVLLKLFTLRR